VVVHPKDKHRKNTSVEPSTTSCATMTAATHTMVTQPDHSG